jgi:hypothetical protein
MTRTNANFMADSGVNISFWFAVLSPLLGILLGFFALIFFFR